MLLAKKNSDEQVHLAEDQAWMKSSSDSDQEISTNMVFMAKMEKILLGSKESSSCAKETIAEVSYYSFDFESDYEYETLDYYDNSTNYGLFVDNDDDQETFHDAINLLVERFETSLYGEWGYWSGVILLIFLTHSDEALEIEKFIRARENKIEFAYDYGNLNEKKIIITLEDEAVSLLEKEKLNLEIIESLKSKGFESSENAISELENQSENECQMVEKGCDNLDNAKVIAPGIMPQQNGVVERRNRTLVEAARTMITFSNLPLFLWAEAIVTACFTQKRSIIHKSFDKTPYPFDYRCYLLNDYDDVGKLKEKGDIGVFVGYLKESAAFRIYNKRT
ncbi:retrovirus-related pol polyprotein from transposon TNT 1-94 [Tanacetum coccineum]